MSVRWSYSHFLNYFILLCYYGGVVDVDVGVLLHPKGGIVQGQVIFLNIVEERTSKQVNMAGMFWRV